MIDRKELLETIVEHLVKEGATRVVVFGSYARGEESPGSDIDILVDFMERKSLLDLVRIEREIFEDIGIRVDLLSERSISPYLIDSIKKESEVIYG